MSNEQPAEKDKGYLEATIDFGKHSLCFGSDMIQRIVPFTFKGIDYEIIFPNFIPSPSHRPGDTGSAEWIPTFSGTKVTLNWNQPQTKHVGKYGSSYRQTKDGLALEFSLSCIVIRSKYPLLFSATEQAKQDLATWRDYLTAWLEATDLIDLENESIHVEQDQELSAYFVPTDKTSRKSSFIKDAHPRSINLYLNKLDTISLELLQRTLTSVNNKAEQPPRYYTSLVTAIKYHNKKDYRNSLLNTSTAIEMALTELLDRRLATINPEQKNSILKDTYQMANLVRALKITGLVLSNDILGKIAQPRNAAIHRGVDVNKLKSGEAIDVAKKFMISLLPIDE